jgi:Mg-chelatase subunit ChlD
MNPELPQDPNEQREAEVTALLLGELPPEKASALLQAIERDPDLARLHQRLKHAIELVRSISPGLDEQLTRESAPLRLGEQRRQRLLQQFKTVTPPEFARPSRSAREWLVPMAAALVLVAMAAGLLLPSLSKAKAKVERSERLGSLSEIDGAKQQWVSENKTPALKTPAAPPPASSAPEPRKFAIVLPSSGTPSNQNGITSGTVGVSADEGTRTITVVTDDATVASAASAISNNLAFSGDPEWIGALDKSGATHSPNNAFISRNAYIASGQQTLGPIKDQQNGNLGLLDRSGQQADASKLINQLRVTPDPIGSSTIVLPASPDSRDIEITTDPGIVQHFAFSGSPVANGGTVPSTTLDGAAPMLAPPATEEAPPMVAASEPPSQDSERQRSMDRLAFRSPKDASENRSFEFRLGKSVPLTQLPGSPAPEPSAAPGLVVANGGSANVPNLGDVPAMGSLFRFKSEASNAQNGAAGQGGIVSDNSLQPPQGRFAGNFDAGQSEAISDSRAKKLPVEAAAKAGADQTQPAEKYTVNVVGYVNTVIPTNAYYQATSAPGVNAPLPPTQLAFDEENPAVVTESGREVTITNAVVLDEKEDLPAARPAAPAPEPQPEIQTADNAFSTFSLNVSDVSFKLAAASLQQGVLPEASSIRSEEFLNAFDYRDPEPPPGVPIAFTFERARDPFAQNRDLLRFSLKTAASGRDPGRPLNIVLLLDDSGSMDRADRVQIIHEALRVLAAQLHPQDTLSVVIFARTARLWVDGVSGSQAAQVADEVGGLTPQGGTNLEDAMNLAYETALRHYLANGINRVVLLTDGAANLGNVDANVLKQKVEANRKQGIALDCFGIGWEGYNDDLLETLTRNGDGRYGFLNTPEEAAEGFAGQLAGALHVAASDVKVQVEFNPARVTAYRQIGYAKHQLTKEQFRDNSVNAAQIGAAEAGNALYAIAVNPRGEGPLATVHVRYRIPGTSDYREHEWTVIYTGSPVPLERSSAAMRLEATAGAFSEWLAGSPFAADVTPDQLLRYLSGVPQAYGADTRPKTLEWMIRESKSLSGK